MGMLPIKIKTPLTKDIIKKLSAGDEVLLSGIIFTARDEVHKKLSDLIKKNRHVPLNLKDACIYYCGPAPAGARRPIGSCGPTTSSRMDDFTPALLKLGLAAMIGKGRRSEAVRRAIKRYGAVYFVAVGGTGALLATKVKSAKAILFKELGPEAVYKLDVRDFPATVGIDSKGRDLYAKTG